MKQKFRVRFAPSPTGHLHLGGLRTALFNWLFARRHEGTYLLRIEDTDIERSRKEYFQSQLDSLTWMGLLPDEPIIHQRANIKAHRKGLTKLLESGQAYRCFCRLKRTNDDSKNQVIQKYPGTCRDKKLTDEDLQKPHVIRFRLEKDIDVVTFHDLIRGPISFSVDQFDDFIIRRSDGTPIYNFCAVIDDNAMRISHVIRGEDHISNTPKQLLLYKALGFIDIPQFVHLPLILGPSGNRLSKRDSAVSVKEYQEAGYTADALFNYLVRLGWSHGDREIFTRSELAELFSLSKIGKNCAIFDIPKLTWVNSVYMRKMTAEELLKSIADMNPEMAKELQQLWSLEKLTVLLNSYKERTYRLDELARQIKILADEPVHDNKNFLRKFLCTEAKQMLEEYIEFLLTLKDEDMVDSSIIADYANKIAQKYQVKIFAFARPLRLALTGKTSGPGIFQLATVFSINKIIQRIENLLKVL